MSTYQITVLKDGNHLFTTERQSVGCDQKDKDRVAKELADAFCEKSGYEARLIIWPTEYGDVTVLTAS